MLQVLQNRLNLTFIKLQSSLRDLLHDRRGELVCWSVGEGVTVSSVGVNVKVAVIVWVLLNVTLAVTLGVCVSVCCCSPFPA